MDDQKRIILWAVPRSMSTAFMRAMLSRDSCKGVTEPWILTYYYSDDRLSDRYSKEDFPSVEGTTFKERKELLEGPFEGHKEIFVKGMAFRMGTFLRNNTVESVLPKGYIHTFITRSPRKNIPSGMNNLKHGHAGFTGLPSEEECSHEIMFLLHEYVTKTLGQKSIVIDGEELLLDPEGILRQYCEAVGIDFQDSMLNWKPLTLEQLQEWGFLADWFQDAANSNGFRKPPKADKYPPISELPEVVQKYIEENVVWYEKMCETRLRPREFAVK